MTEDINGWTAKQVKEFIEAILREHDRRYSQTLTDLDQRLTARIGDLTDRLDERYATQTRAVDAAFVAQQTALKTGLDSAEKAVQVALLAADRATTKAEIATERRLEGLNELRKLASDQAAYLMPRAESEQRMGVLSEKITETNQAIGSIREMVLSGAAGTEGRTTAYRETTQYSVYIFCAVIGVIAVIVAHFVR